MFLMPRIFQWHDCLLISVDRSPATLPPKKTPKILQGSVSYFLTLAAYIAVSVKRRLVYVRLSVCFTSAARIFKLTHQGSTGRGQPTVRPFCRRADTLVVCYGPSVDL